MMDIIIIMASELILSYVRCCFIPIAFVFVISYIYRVDELVIQD